MTFVDFVRGLGTMLFIMIVAGGVAYVGDRVGHQVGRRRLTLFGIRPRYTSTIVAIGTGMVIALVVMLGAILASQQVKTAFFRLNSINQEIAQLQGRQQQLEQKVNNGRLVFPTDTLMYPRYATIHRSDSPDRRSTVIKAYYRSAVAYINANYPPLGLKAYKSPADIETRLGELSTSQNMQAQLMQGDVLLLVASDQNLFVNDQIHFLITSTPDTLRFVKGHAIASVYKIPGGPGTNINIAISQLQANVSAAAREALLPSFLASSVRVIQILPDLTQMQQALAKPGLYALTAYAQEDVYPHTGGIPIIIALSAQAPGGK